MSTIGVRELARHASSIINDIEQKKEPALVTRRGRPVVYMLPVDSEEFEDFVLAHAPQFVDGIAAADAELAAGETVSFAEVRAELEAESPQAIARASRLRSRCIASSSQARDARPPPHRPQSRRRLLDLLEEELAAEPQPANLDIKALDWPSALAAAPPRRVPRR